MIAKHFNRQIRFAHCNAQKGEELVQSGLAYTPAEMYDLAKQGKPIGSQILPDDNFDDGEPMCKTEVSLDNQRGIDINQAWEATKDAQSKFKQFSKQNHQTEPKSNV